MFPGQRGSVAPRASSFCKLFFGTLAANSGRVSWTEVVVAVALRRAAQATATSAL